MTDQSNAQAKTYRPGQRWMTAVFVVLLGLMMILGATLVTLQAGSLILGNGPAMIHWSDAIEPWLYGISATFGVWTLLLSYVAGWKAAD